MGDSATKIIDPANTFTGQTKTKNYYQEQLPDFLRAENWNATQPFQTPVYKSALENYYQKPFADVQSDIYNWFLTNTPKKNVRVRSVKTPTPGILGNSLDLRKQFNF